MEVERLYDWRLNIDQVLEMQRWLQDRVSRSERVTSPCFIVGVDIATGKDRGMTLVAIMVPSYPRLGLGEMVVAQGEFDFPYIPEFLSFREPPLILGACGKLSVTPDLILVDEQGVTHPRRMGLACHLCLLVDTSTIDYAKPRFCGSHRLLGNKPGGYAEMVGSGENIGVAFCGLGLA